MAEGPRDLLAAVVCLAFLSAAIAFAGTPSRSDAPSGPEGTVQSGGAGGQPRVGYEDGFYLRAPDETWELRLNGRVAAHAFFFEPDSGQKNTALIDRGRLGVDVRVYRYFRLRLENDFAFGEGLRDAFVAVRLGPAAEVQFGQFKIPFSFEQLRSKRYIDFVERAAVVNNTVSPARDIGVMLSGSLAGKRVEYQAAVVNGAGQNRADDNSDKDGIVRAVLRPFPSTSQLRGWNFGAAFAYGNQPADRGAERRSIAGKTETGVTFFPAVPRAGKRLRVGTHAAWFEGPFSATAEFIHTEEQRPREGEGRLGRLRTDGAYVGGSWLLTGESKPVNSRLYPARPFRGPEGGGWGAWEAVARLQFFELAHAPDPALPAPSRNRYDGIALGVNWYPNEFLRVSLDYFYGHFERPAAGAPDPTRHASNAVAGRIQFEF
jgi:phosphate-selective porin OprO/OprP